MPNSHASLIWLEIGHLYLRSTWSNGRSIRRRSHAQQVCQEPVRSTIIASTSN
jgi:hypothetical protein